MWALEHCDAPGILLVFSQPTAQKYIREIEEWYDTEHGPARLKLGEEYFLNGYRFRSSTGRIRWLAIYEMQRLSAGTQSPYTSLRANRSQREQDIFRAKLEITSRQFLRLLRDTGCSSQAAGRIYIISAEVDGHGDQASLSRWYCDKVFNLFARLRCTRSRLFQLVDGTDVGKDQDQDHNQAKARIVGVHDFVQASNGLESHDVELIERTLTKHESVVQCSGMQAFTFQNEFSALDYRAPIGEDPDSQPRPEASEIRAAG